MKQRLVNRKGAGKAGRDLEDIIREIKSTDPEHLPLFVARDLQKLPPVSFDHVDVTRLFKDILVLQKELRTIQETLVERFEYATVQEVQQLKFLIDQLKNARLTNIFDSNVNYKRGAYCLQDSYELNSGPMGMTHHSANKELSPE